MNSDMFLFRYLSTICDAIGCWNEGFYEKEITVLDTLNVPFTLATYACEKHGDG